MTLRPRGPRWPGRLLCAALGVAALWLVFLLYRAGQPLWAVVVLAGAAIGFGVYLSERALAYRYLLPGLAAMLIFVVGPLVYTAQIGFTNFSSNNLLSLQRATDYLLDQTSADESRAMTFTLHPDGDGFRLLLSPLSEADGALPAAAAAPQLISPRLDLQRADKRVAVTMQVLDSAASAPASAALPLIQVLQHRAALQKLQLTLPDGSVIRYAGVREFGPLRPVWQRAADGSLTRLEDGAVYRPNGASGFYESSTGARLQPGFKVNVGFRNYVRMLSDPDFRGPFLKIFVWTVILAGLTVVLTTSIGLGLAVMLNWESLRFRTAYRTLLFLPYAVPAFISILVFKGLFNQNFGEINLVLNALFGIKPAWFAEPILAQCMILIVNTWLGYPYIMVLCTGLIKAIPADLYEASAIAGARPLNNFFKITVPLILKPLTPILINVFAFNFNNFVLIALLTDGRPDFLNTKLPAGTTDILVSYTYRIAFKDSGQNFGLAAAISTVIFFMVALLSLANLKMAKLNKP